MILCFLLIHASEYLIISDRNKTPLNSTKKFETARHRFLYDTIIRYVTDYARQNQGLNITGIILKHIKNRMQGVQVSIDEIKLMFVTDIVNKFKIGHFHFCMLDLAKDFDDDLIKHWNVLAQYDLEQIQRSLGKNYSDLKENDFWINKSVSYIFLAYGTLFYEMLLSQIYNKRWSYVKGNDFDVQINKVTMLYAYHFDFIFKKDGCYYEEIDFNIKHIFRIKPTFRAAKAMMSRDHNQPIYIYAIYSFDEMFNAIKRFFYRTNKSTRNTPEKNAYIMLNTLKKNENMRRIRSIRTQFFKKEKYKIKMLDRVMDYEPSYFFYFHIQAETDGVFSFDAWKGKVVIYNNVIDLSYFIVYQWLEYRI